MGVGRGRGFAGHRSVWGGACDGTSDAALRATLQGWRDRVREELLGNVIPFWERFSLDAEHGGYLDHLDRDGAPFDSKKHAWLQAQELWLWSRLHHDVEKRASWLAAANSGAAASGGARRQGGCRRVRLPRPGPARRICLLAGG